MLLAALVGFMLIAAAFVPKLAQLSTYATTSFSILAAIAFILGAGNFLRSHLEKVRRQVSGWAYSLIALLAFSFMLISGLFKINVTPKPGSYCWMQAAGSAAVALAEIDEDDDGLRKLAVRLRKAPAGQEYAVTIDGKSVGAIKTDEAGAGILRLADELDAEGKRKQSAELDVLRSAKPPGEIAVGSLLKGPLLGYSRLTGELEAPTAWYGYTYLYAFVPLQQTTFALLAFFVASAAFRAFRARNVESVLLLGTAFIILLGRTAAGTWLTKGLPDEGLLSFFDIPTLSNWIMAYPFTAGGRAILIGICLGVISTSLKVLLGIDRSYLGSDRGGS